MAANRPEKVVPSHVPPPCKSFPAIIEFFFQTWAISLERSKNSSLLADRINGCEPVGSNCKVMMHIQAVHSCKQRRL